MRVETTHLLGYYTLLTYLRYLSERRANHVLDVESEIMR